MNIKKRPTVKELEQILADAGDREIRLQSDGSITSEAVPETVSGERSTESFESQIATLYAQLVEYQAKAACGECCPCCSEVVTLRAANEMAMERLREAGVVLTKIHESSDATTRYFGWTDKLQSKYGPTLADGLTESSEPERCADTERLDWLEREASELNHEPYIEFDSAGPWWIVRVGLGGATATSTGDTLREAIDRARETNQ